MANVLITGSTGMIGKGVLLACIDDDSIETIVLLNRNPIGLKNTKIKEVLLQDFTQLAALKDQFGPLDACFHCMGVSALGLNENQYSKITFEVTKVLIDVCYEINSNMTFNYVSGQGSDSSEKGKQMWARVKGKTENYLLAKGFSKAYAFRPGFIIPERSIRSRTKLYDNIYRVMKPLFPLLKKMKDVTTTERIARVMIKTIYMEQTERYLSNRQINAISSHL